MKKTLTDHAILVLDNCEVLSEEEQVDLAMLIHYCRDTRFTISFVLIYNGKLPNIIQEGFTRIHMQKLMYPSLQIAQDYFSKIHVPADFQRDVFNITGSSWKYMSEISNIPKDLPRDRFMGDAKLRVSQRIQNEIKPYLDEERYKEIVNVFKTLLTTESMSLSSFWTMMGNNFKNEDDHKTHWSAQFLQKPFLDVSHNSVFFESSAVKMFVKEWMQGK